MKRICPILFVTLSVLAAFADVHTPSTFPSLVPLPRELKVNEGELELEAASIDKLPITEHKAKDLPKEGYRLVVDACGIRVDASTPAGFFYARQTLRQLAVRSGQTLRVPFVEIKDEPAYAWRGLMLDEGRHFFGKETVKRILDRMASEKLNVFHWHLTEDQGWRIALDKFPELEKYATVRAESVARTWTHANKVKDGKRYGPYFYTRAELEEVVAYARERFIEVVPEVELPGHARAALAAYPQYSCLGERLKPREAWSDIGVCPEVFCAGNDEALKFLEGVLDEVCDIFPSKAIHFGGDECPKTRWRACAKCQRRVREEGLKDVEALQGWMTRRFAAYLAKKGRTAIGWHEILAGGADPRTTVVQNWRQPSIGVAAATNGFRVIQSPYLETYFSFPQGLGAKDPYTYRSPGHQLTLEKAYQFDPAAGLTDRTNLLGSECCLWTEMVFDEKEVFWKLWPRASAFAEAVWTAPKPRDFKGFLRRCQSL